MDRFYTVKEHIGALQPVNTNCSTDVTRVKLVIVCESPSYDEVKKGFPMASSTGARIYKHLIRSNMIDSNSNYTFESKYDDFSRNGIYFTNLVRYQADLHIKGSRSKKDSNVRNLWSRTKKQIFDELCKISEEFQGAKVLFACGYAFKAQLKEVTTLLNSLNIEWFVTSHPSRSNKMLSSNYNPDFWESINITKTQLMKDLEEYHRAQSTRHTRQLKKLTH